MDLSPLVPDSSSLRVDQVSVKHDEAVVYVRSSRPVRYCPQCGRPASRVHSQYSRTLQDLSWQGTRVTIRWRSRKFFCDAPGCPQRIFTEQIPAVANRYSRRTARAREVLECLGLALGGEGGSKVARRLHLPISGDSLLRALRRMAAPSLPTSHVIGVDDWALRRGQRYGTVIVDLEERKPIDLLPDRKWETLRDWLVAHPGVEIVSRDRADGYMHGISAGAPHAIQVADRWHLLKNLREALQRSAERYSAEIQQAAQEVVKAELSDKTPSITCAKLPDPHGPPIEKPLSIREIKRSRRVGRYQRVRQSHSQGRSQREISRTLHMNRKTVRRFIQAEQFPERVARPLSGCVAPYLDDLQRLWNQGCRNARTLTKEIESLGYRGTYYSIRRAVARWRDGATDASDRPSVVIANPPSARQVSWLLFLEGRELEPAEQMMVYAIRDQCPQLGLASDLAREFTSLIKQHHGGELANWIARADSEPVPLELRRFAQGLLADLPAIQAAATLPWSNGQTEGQINRLKLTKRTMYGRAKLDLLRARFLARSDVR